MSQTSPDSPQAPWRRLLQIGYAPWLILAALLLVPCALFLLWLHIAMASAADYHDQITSFLSKQLGQEVSIGSVRAEIRGGWQPVLFLEDLQSRNAPGNFALKIQKAELALNPLTSLLLRKARFSLLHLHGVHLYSAIPMPWYRSGSATAETDTAYPVAPLENWPKEIRIDDLEVHWRFGTGNDTQRRWRARHIALWRQGPNLRSRGSLEVIGDPAEKLHFEFTALWTGGKVLVERAQAHIALQNGDAATWSKLLRGSGVTALPGGAAGRFQGRLESRWQNKHGWHTNALLQSDHLEWTHHETRVALRELSLQISARHGATEHERYALALDSLRTASGSWPRTLLHLVREPRGKLIALHCDTLALATAADFLPLLVLSETVSKSFQLPKPLPHGTLRELHWQRPEKTPTAPRWSALLENLDWEGDGEWPAFQGLQGRVYGVTTNGGVATKGKLEFQTRRLQLFLPDLYPDAPPILEQGRGALSWETNSHGAVLNLLQLESQVDELPLSLHGQMRFEAFELKEIAIELALENVDLPSFLRHLPPGRMPPETLRKVQALLPRGHLQSALMKLRGNPDDWPFPKQEGYFHFQLDLTDSEFHFHPDWQPLTSTQARVTMDSQRLQARIQKAYLYEDLTLEGHIELPDYSEESIQVRAHTQGALDTLRHWLLTTPLLEPAWQEPLRTLAPGGETIFSLELDLLGEQIKAWRARLRLQNAQLDTGAPGGGRLEKLHGVVDITAAGLRARQVRGHWRGAELLLDLDFNEKDSERFLVTAHGRSDAEPLRHLVTQEFPAFAGFLEEGRLRGATSWRAELQFDNTSNYRPYLAALRFHSDLQGLSSQFPAPLAKESTEQLPLRVHYRYPSQKGDNAARQLEIQWGEGLRLQAQTLLESGHSSVNVQLEQLLLPEWLKLWGRATAATPPAPAPAPSAPMLPWRLGLEVGRVTCGPLQLAATNFQLERDSLGNLQGSLGGAMEGSWKLPNHPDAVLQIALKHLHLASPAIAAETPQEAATPTQQPPQVGPTKTFPPSATHWPLERASRIQLGIGELRLGEVNHGSLEASFLGKNDGALMESFRLQGDLLQVQGDASWTGAGGDTEETRLDLHLHAAEITHVLRLLLEDPGILQGAETDLKLHAAWNSAPHQFSLEKAYGKMLLQVDTGRIKEVDHLLLRLLGLLQFKKLFDILSLNFSTIFGTGGTSFQRIDGTLNFSQGIGESELQIHSDTFHLGVAGYTGLVARDYNQVAIFTPYTLSGAIKGVTQPLGPFGQIVQGLLDKILLNIPQNIDESLRLEYHITGSWDMPVVKALHFPKNSTSPLGSPPGAPRTNPP